MSQGPEAPRPFEDPVPPPELDELWAEAPELRTSEVWARVQARLVSEPRDTAPRRLVPLSLPRAIPVGRTGRQVAALAAGLLVAGGLAAGVVLGTTGTASAGFAEDVAALGDQTQAALADGVIDDDELATLQAAAMALAAQLSAGEDLGDLSVQELDTVIATLVAVRSALVEAGMGGGPAAGSTLSELATVGSAVRLERAARATDALVVALPAQTNSPHIAQIIAAADLPVTVTAGDGGTVQFDVQDGAIVIGDVSPAAGWDADIVQDKGDKAKVRFENGDHAIQVHADLTDGDLRIKTIIDDGDAAAEAAGDDGDDDDAGTAAVDGVHSFQAGDAALVTLDLTAGVLTVANIELEDGWTLDGSIDDEDDEDEIKLRFFTEDTEVLFKAELDDGEIEVKVTTQSLDDDAQSLSGDEEDGDDDNDKRPMRFPLEGTDVNNHTFDIPGGEVHVLATLDGISELEVTVDEEGGWELHTNRINGHAARIELRNDDGGRVRLKIELVGDEILVKIEEIQTGRNGDGSEIESKGRGGDNGQGLGRPDGDDDDGPGRSGEARDRDDDSSELQTSDDDDDDHGGEDDGEDGHDDDGVTEDDDD